MGLLTGLVRSLPSLTKSRRRSQGSKDFSGEWQGSKEPCFITNPKEPTSYRDIPEMADLSRLYLQNVEPLDLDMIPQQVADLTVDMKEMLQRLSDLEDRVAAQDGRSVEGRILL